MRSVSQKAPLAAVLIGFAVSGGSCPTKTHAAPYSAVSLSDMACVLAIAKQLPNAPDICAAATKTPPAAPTISGTPDLLIMGGRDHKDYLGCLTCGDAGTESVYNSYSEYGWQNKYGKWNRYGPYANPYSGDSACNELTSDGPVIVDRLGKFYARLTVNKLAANSICGIGGSPQLCSTVKVMCSGA